MSSQQYKHPKALLIGLVAAAAFGLIGLMTTTAHAQQPPNDECSDGWCGTPHQTGGGGCGCGGGGSILVNNTDDGKTYQHTDDWDADGVPDQIDNCPYIKNRDQADQDGDGVGDACDNCPMVANANQSDVNANGIGDLCDPDADSDGVPNAQDNCWLVPNPVQEDANKNGQGDVCDPDADGDGVPNEIDNCPLVFNPDQKTDGIFGKACDFDYDKDGVEDLKLDNCPGVYNPDQKRSFPVKTDKNGNVTDRRGDACNPDIDSDNILNNVDNCPVVVNPDQLDSDHDGVGDACSRRFCFVVQRQDRDQCLDPSNTFQVYSPTLPMIENNGQVDPDNNPVTGQAQRLRLFANRQNVAIQYNWTVVSSPPGSNAAIDFPQGAVSFSTPWEYHYQADRVVTFTPDLPGRYVLKVSAQQVFSDPVNGSWPRNADYQVSINVSGDAMTGGCSAGTGRAAGGGAAAMGLLALALLLGRSVLRTRRSVLGKVERG